MEAPTEEIDLLKVFLYALLPVMDFVNGVLKIYILRKRLIIQCLPNEKRLVYNTAPTVQPRHSQGRTFGALLLLRNALLIYGALPQTA